MLGGDDWSEGRGEGVEAVQHRYAVLAVALSNGRRGSGRDGRAHGVLHPHRRVRTRKRGGDGRAQEHLHIAVGMRRPVVTQVLRHGVCGRHNRQPARVPQHELTEDLIAVARVAMVERRRAERARPNNLLDGAVRRFARRSLPDV